MASNLNSRDQSNDQVNRGTTLQKGIYNNEYFSGAQVALYIGDVWVDDVTSLAFNVGQNRVPLYGYADQLFRDMSKGQVLVQGQFSINFKEAGYLFVILSRYKELVEGKGTRLNPFISGDAISQANIENMIGNKTITASERNAMKQALTAMLANDTKKGEEMTAFKKVLIQHTANSPEANLLGYATDPRLGKSTAESAFEIFEDAIWGKDEGSLDERARRADADDLNPFDIYIAYGDFMGNDRVNHTIQKIVGVHIVGTSKQIVIDGQPIQETYNFLAKNVV